MAEAAVWGVVDVGEFGVCGDSCGVFAPFDKSDVDIVFCSFETEAEPSFSHSLVIEEFFAAPFFEDFLYSVGVHGGEVEGEGSAYYDGPGEIGVFLFHLVPVVLKEGC